MDEVAEVTIGPHKVCKKCETNKPIEAYHKDRSAKDGHRAYCKDCVKEYNKRYYNKPKEAMEVIPEM